MILITIEWAARLCERQKKVLERKWKFLFIIYQQKIVFEDIFYTKSWLHGTTKLAHVISTKESVYTELVSNEQQHFLTIMNTLKRSQFMRKSYLDGT